uniref:Uncharacterized protein n=1 Tax=Amphiprion ocellaris TaxID=80972 RepID=A0AAQ5ZJR3_AMPOC
PTKSGPDAVRTQPPNPSHGEPDSPSWSRAQASLGVFQTRSIFHLPRRSSSGYFSADGADSVPSSPLSPKRLTADKATQTPSPSGQVIKHALERMTDEAHGGGPGTQQHGELRLFICVTREQHPDTVKILSLCVKVGLTQLVQATLDVFTVNLAAVAAASVWVCSKI